MRKLPIFLVVLLLWTGCSRSPYPGYKSLGGDLYLRLITLGEGERLLTDSDHVVLVVRASVGEAAPGSLYSTERFSEAWSLLGSGLGPVMRGLHEGDSASVWVRAQEVPWESLGSPRALADTGMVRLDLLMRSVKSADEVRAETAAYNAWRVDRELEEQAELERYFHTHGIDKRTTSYQGIYILEHKPGTVPLLKTGDAVTIAYVARALNGTVFDDTYKGGTPLSFRLGDPGQVIRGLEIGLRKLGRGGRATFLIPSQFAFGDDGSAAGIVPPFTTVVYELEVLDEAASARPGS
jgi:FKBP-type peptidyl-prolyl cis-trans isomerase